MHPLDPMIHGATGRAVCAALALFLSNAAYGQIKKNAEPTATPGGVSPTIDWAAQEARAKLTFKFSGTPMTDQRAAAIANSENFDLVSWQICPSADNCMILEVAGRKQGWIYRYVLVGEKCTRVATPSKAPAADANIHVSPETSASAQPRKAGGAADGSAQTADRCFGEYPVVMRARQHDSYSANNEGYTGRLEEIWQQIVRGTWTPFVTTIVGFWDLPVPNSGMNERGTSYSWTNGSGKVVRSDSKILNWIASGGSTTGVTAKDLCQASQAFHKDRLTEALEASVAVCTAVPIPQSITVKGGIAGEGAPLGVGGNISLDLSGTKTIDFCGLSRNVALQQIAVIVDTEYRGLFVAPRPVLPEHVPTRPHGPGLGGRTWSRGDHAHEDDEPRRLPDQQERHLPSGYGRGLVVHDDDRLPV